MIATPKLRVGMIGLSGFGTYRRQSLRESGLYELVACYDISNQAMQQTADEDGAEPMPSYQAMLDRDDIDAVIISTGASSHATHLLAAIEHGKACFVEKPLVATPDELDAVLAAYEKANVVVGSGHTNHAKHAVSQTINQLIRSNALGDIVTFEATTAHSGGLKMKSNDWRADPNTNPGGMLFQCGVHVFHELMYYFGPIQSISARTNNRVTKSKTDDVALCHVEFANGLIGSVNAYHVTPAIHTMMIAGTQALVMCDDNYFRKDTALWLQRRDPTLSGCEEIREPIPIRHNSSSAESDYGQDQMPCEANLVSFYHAVKNHTEPTPSIYDAARAVQAVFYAVKSARSGHTVTIPPIDITQNPQTSLPS